MDNPPALSAATVGFTFSVAGSVPWTMPEDAYLVGISSNGSAIAVSRDATVDALNWVSANGDRNIIAVVDSKITHKIFPGILLYKGESITIYAPSAGSVILYFSPVFL